MIDKLDIQIGMKGNNVPSLYDLFDLLYFVQE